MIKQIKIVVEEASSSYDRYGGKILSGEGHIIVDGKQYEFYFDEENGFTSEAGEFLGKLTEEKAVKIEEKITDAISEKQAKKHSEIIKL